MKGKYFTTQLQWDYTFQEANSEIIFWLMSMERWNSRPITSAKHFIIVFHTDIVSFIHSSAAWWFSSVEIVFFTSSLVSSLLLLWSQRDDTQFDGFVLTLEWFQNDLQITIEDFDSRSVMLMLGKWLSSFRWFNIRLASSFKVIAFISNKVYPLSLVIQTIPIVFEHFSIDR